MVNGITYIISTLFTYIMGILSKKFGWNEEMPIPVQNILIALLVLGTTLIIQWITKEPIDLKSIIEQILSALGGAGTATLCYDNWKGLKKDDI